MEISKTNIPEVLLFEPTIHGDNRGYFMETFRAAHFEENGLDFNFVQDNQSRSQKGTLRGLHYQLHYPQGKLARVTNGEIFDVAVDLRSSSPTFGQWAGEILSAKNKKQLWIPPGFAHGFLVLSDSADLLYKCTDYYRPEDEHSLFWKDPDLAIAWPEIGVEPIISEKDQLAQAFSSASVYK
ncbi:MAG: dTDP-4-dehydrorhamnose 3,5-epimerase [Gammaproteobacteria bacterium]|nr:dTDP-4-dehydrorhamnose 3,5-epimerase [Gammaproteobacteria bacterium]